MTVRRVLANLCWMVPGDVGGSEEYTTRLLGLMTPSDAAGAEGPEVTVAAMAGVAPAHPQLASLRWRTVAVSGRVRPLRVLTESTWLARESRRHDLVHHFGGRVPAIRGAPAIVTVHDIQPLERPDDFSHLKRAYLAKAVPRSVAISRMVVTPSAWVAGRLVERFSLDESRVRVVPSTYSTDPHQPDLTAAGSDRTPIPALAPGDGPLIVYPAVTHPHKDHATLLEAFALLRQRRGGARLLLTGGRGRAHGDVERLIAATPGAMHCGRVAPAVLREMIERADVVAFPSRYEGFGLPLLEAMRAGTPVVAADATAIPEVVGGGAILVEPGAVASWADALLAVVDDGVDAAVTEAAEQRVEHYSPANARDRLLAAWDVALDGG